MSGADAARPTIAGTLRAAIARLREAGLDTPELDARLLLAHAAGLDTTDLVARSRDEIDPAALHRVDTFVSRRLKGESPARIRGAREFWGLDFQLGPETLEPRPDSETLVESVLETLAELSQRGSPLRVADLGTGSGCLLLALLSELPNGFGTGVDLSLPAVLMARRNAALNGLADHARFVVGSWADSLSAGHDVILSNPPYIRKGDIDGLGRDVAHNEPRLALDGGPDGLDAYRALIPSARESLRPHGLLALEIGFGQSDAVATLLKVEGFGIREIRRDLSGIERAILAVRRG